MRKIDDLQKQLSSRGGMKLESYFSTPSYAGECHSATNQRRYHLDSPEALGGTFLGDQLKLKPRWCQSCKKDRLLE